jgi:neutral ceramidase
MRYSASRNWTRAVLPNCVVFVLGIASLPLAAETFKAGADEVDIAAPPGLPLYGYFERMQKYQVASGTLDALYARVLVLETGEKRVALVTLDLGRTFSQPWLDRLNETAQANSGIDDLIVTASHTHSGPNILDQYPDGQLPQWEIAALEKIARAIHEAAGRLVPARLGIGYGDAYIGYNRRQVNSNGSVTMLWSNPDKLPTTPIDPIVTVIRVDRLDGTPLAILIDYACHPVVFGPDNLRYSADYVGVMLKTVAAEFDGKAICFFLQGAGGDINPYYATTPLNQGAIEKRDWTGRQLGIEAARIAQHIRTQTPSRASLDFADDVIAFPLRWNAQKFHDDLVRVYGPAVFQDHAGMLATTPPPPTLALHIATLLINKQIALAGMPGEPFVDFQMNWRDRCPVRDCVFLGYTNGYFDYLPTVLAASQGGYGAADSNTYIEVGAGERMLNHALVRVHEMLGELRRVPQSADEAFRVR